MLESLKHVMFVEYANTTFIGIVVSIILIVLLLYILVKQHKIWKGKIKTLTFEVDNRIKSEQKKSAEAIIKEREQAADEIVAEQRRSHDELEKMRKNLEIDKNQLARLSEKELIVMTITNLSKIGYRLDSLEKQGVYIQQSISEKTETQDVNKYEADEDNYTFDNYGMFDSDECIRCMSHADQNTIDLLYNSLHYDNRDTSAEDNMVDAMSTLDSNVYNLCKAIIFQGFMSMRKVDKLYDLLRKEGTTK